MTETKPERYIRLLSGLDGAEISAEACKELVELLKEPKKRGKWITEKRSMTIYPHRCSECGANHRAKYDYCPNCGADMRDLT